MIPTHAVHGKTPSGSGSALVEGLLDYVPRVIREIGTPGLNLAVALDGEFVWEGAFGFADLRNGVPMSPNTVGRVGSVTKSYLVTAVLHLVDRQVIGLYDPVERYINDLKLCNPLGERAITVYDLVTFRSGIRTDTVGASLTPPKPLGEYLRDRLDRGTRQEYGGIHSLWAEKVGVRYQYSSFACAILGHLIDVVNPEGLTCSEYIAKYITEPLGMTSTKLPSTMTREDVGADIFDRISTGYSKYGSVYVPSPLLHSAVYPAIGLLSTPGDHLRWLLAIQNGGTFGGRRILKPETVAMMLTPHVRRSHGRLSDSAWEGLMIELGNLGTKDEFFGRTGTQPWGWYTHGKAYRRRGVAVAIFSNRWEMTGWYNADRRVAAGLIQDYIVRRSDHPAPVLPVRSRTEGWTAAYAMGLVTAERTLGLLSAEGSLTDALDEMVTGAADLDGKRPDGWDPEGFAAGVRRIVASDLSPEAIRATLESDDLDVLPEQLRLAWHRLGNRGDVPIPHAFWADAPRIGDPPPERRDDR